MYHKLRELKRTIDKLRADLAATCEEWEELAKDACPHYDHTSYDSCTNKKMLKPERFVTSCDLDCCPLVNDKRR